MHYIVYLSNGTDLQKSLKDNSGIKRKFYICLEIFRWMKPVFNASWISDTKNIKNGTDR